MPVSINAASASVAAKNDSGNSIAAPVAKLSYAVSAGEGDKGKKDPEHGTVGDKNIDSAEQESGEKVIEEGKLSGTHDIVKRLYDSMFENNTEDGGGILYPDGTDNNSISVKKGTGVNYTKESVSVGIVSFQLLYIFTYSS
jgi:hypothetical protein